MVPHMYMNYQGAFIKTLFNMKYLSMFDCHYSECSHYDIYMYKNPVHYRSCVHNHDLLNTRLHLHIDYKYGIFHVRLVTFVLY